ncbi:hypothetical protein [Sulfurirhabdus autotrophica]|uniref:Uncharacterized protein n=1 Tax=Sulfurirhabdus autotrophica TaxID=1706046 RepID=A0A4V2W341_9PROT|nr:hypothetical protein [Sulfurirhabdus autotrophica]TCV90499.1 hypothetical protein EDC63_101472 [Sulfurirhabdus autotrophica]
MSGHFPFSGNVNRVSVFAFYEKHGLGLVLQEKYNQWWFNWTKQFVANDPGLKAAKGQDFNEFPYGQHAHHDFHLHKYQWCTTMIDLGQFIAGVILPKLSEEQLHKLEEDHHHLLEALHKEAEQTPREATPVIGYFRHT